MIMPLILALNAYYAAGAKELWYCGVVLPHSSIALTKGYGLTAPPPPGWPSWGESVCVMVCVNSQVPLGLRRQIGELWRAYGSREMLPRIRRDEVREVAQTKLAKTG